MSHPHSHWTLEKTGDRVERSLGPNVCVLFPNYAKFWAQHVVPLTSSDESEVHLRA